MNDSCNKLMRGYSQGMLKKISFIGTLLNDQALLVLDEPTNALDPKMISIIKSLLTKFKHEGRTIILSTHILNIAEELADRLAIIEKGRLIFTEEMKNLEMNDTYKNFSSLEELYLNIIESK